jgi:hypothetical protein
MSLLGTLSALTQSVHAYERQLRQAIGLPDAPQAPADCLDACARLEAAALECEAAVRGRLGAPAEAPAVPPAVAARLGVPGRPAPNGAAYRLPEEQGPPPVALEKMTAVGVLAQGESAGAAGAGHEAPSDAEMGELAAVAAGGPVSEEVARFAEEKLGVPRSELNVADKAPPAPASGARKAKGKRR